MSVHSINTEMLNTALDTAVATLLEMRTSDGYWEGQLSSSALSTATALSALAVADLAEDEELIRDGIAWLAQTQNADGGWGDTTDSPSNLATTLLVVSSLRLCGHQENDQVTSYLQQTAGNTPQELVSAIRTCYGSDRTFAVPILMNCALAGLIPWDGIPELPFELAVLPHRWYRAFRLHVVSYALPALIAIGLLLAERVPAGAFRRKWRRLFAGTALKKLAAIQPEHGGFLEATPLTSFVAMSLASLYGADYPVAQRCLGFLRQSVRSDGSWPIDTNLSVWLTTSAVTALGHADRLSSLDKNAVRTWIEAQQYQTVHPYTAAAPGGWGWTHLPGGVPDADDTSGALVALYRLGADQHVLQAGVDWLLGLQNSDGGWPTFCRGWGQLPFDKSSPDITAHALRALRSFDVNAQDMRVQLAIAAGVKYLTSAQTANGAWVPLWFGNQYTPEKTNPVLGTARVLLAWAELDSRSKAVARGVHFLLKAQNADGGWGGAGGIASTTEETALAVSALASCVHHRGAHEALERGAAYLIERIEDGVWRIPTPLGLYFASLWYHEALYPIIWTVEALGKARVAIEMKQGG
ncbi:MAG: prenyltransferase/squalene oxidase repeat-containing protein [Armatimonadota bacterium]